MTDIVPSHAPMAHPIPTTDTEIQHVCGKDRKHAPYCIQCGCWGDTHPGASVGYDCVCTNLQYEGELSREEQDEQRRLREGHYIRKVDFSGVHYCQQPSIYYAWPGEVWQCDVCHQKWKFKRTLATMVVPSMEKGAWKRIR